MRKRNRKGNRYFKQASLCILLASGSAFPVHAGVHAIGQLSEIMVQAKESEPLQMKSKRRDHVDKPIGFPDTKSLILIPEVTIDGHTLHFITPCTGLTIQLVQDDEVYYETVITSDYLEIPSSITGVYELQILRGDYVFFADIDL